MIKFKRLNILQFSEDTKTGYFLNDLLNQSSIEMLINVNKGMSKNNFIEAILSRASVLLKEIVIEKSIENKEKKNETDI